MVTSSFVYIAIRLVLMVDNFSPWAVHIFSKQVLKNIYSDAQELSTI